MLVCGLDRQEMQFAMPYAACSNNMIGKIFYFLDRSTQDGYFQAVVVIHMYMHRG